MKLPANLPSTTIPPWALPDCTLCPDLVLILGWDAKMSIPTSRAEFEQIEFVIADLAYCRGDCSLNAIKRKQAAYDSIATALRARGFRVRGFDTCSLLPAKGKEDAAPHIAALALGISGEVYHATQHVLSALGLNAQATARLIKTLHRHALTETASILATRRHLERMLPAGPQPASATTATLQQPTGVGGVGG